MSWFPAGLSCCRPHPGRFVRILVVCGQVAACVDQVWAGSCKGRLVSTQSRLAPPKIGLGSSNSVLLSTAVELRSTSIALVSTESVRMHLYLGWLRPDLGGSRPLLVQLSAWFLAELG